MKKSLVMFSAACILLACSTRKKTSSTAAADPNEKQLAAVQTKFAGTTMEELRTGHDLYYGTCTGCHNAKKITNWSDEQWPGILNTMAKKAKISNEQKDAIMKYVSGVLLSSK